MEQNSNWVKSRHYRSQLPKGSYHSYCRNRLEQMQQQTLTRANVSRAKSRSFHSTAPSSQHCYKRPIDTAITFQQYLQQLGHTYQKNKSPVHQIKYPGTNRRLSQSKQNKKIENQEIIDSHLPFFKCKLDKSQHVIKRSDFRVKQNKFKMNKNVVQNNCLQFISQSLPLRNL